MNRLAGKIALITGGAMGIGRSACLLMAGEGAKVAVTDVADDEAKFVTGAQLVVDGGYTAR